MSFSFIFKRAEQKYRVPASAQAGLEALLAEQMAPAEYPHGTNCSLYYDTDGHDVIIQSMEKPEYKEKLRLRSYGVPGEDTIVFIELKKKYRGTTYKRRESLPYREAVRFLDEGIYPSKDTQIMREIAYFLQQNPVKPSLYIAYDRDSYCGVRNPDLRATVDHNIRFRTEDLSLAAGTSGHLLDLSGDALLEVKAEGSLPLPLIRGLHKLKLFPESFSKFATAYAQSMVESGRLAVPAPAAAKADVLVLGNSGIPTAERIEGEPLSVWGDYLAFADRYKEKARMTVTA